MKGPTGHKHITHHPKSPRFNVYIRSVWLGCHDTLQEAIQARDKYLASVNAQPSRIRSGEKHLHGNIQEQGPQEVHQAGHVIP